LPKASLPTRPRRDGWATTTQKLTRLCREAIGDGFELIKLKVGADLDEDVGASSWPGRRWP
jgi:L-fuconate dehydratase